MPRLSNSRRREAILAALERGNISAAASEYGVSRQSLHELVKSVSRDPDGAVQEAEEELVFRHQVAALQPHQAKPEEES